MMMDSHKLALRRQRGRLAFLLVVGSFVVLSGAFFRLQIISGDQYVLRSEENRFRAIKVPAPRGTIYDRNGRVVAENVPGYVISVLPGPRDTIAATIDRLAAQLEITVDSREALLLQNRQRPNEPLVIRDNARFEQVTFIEERRPQFRRVVVESRPRRLYPMGPATAHMVGYVGEISEQELTQDRWEGYEARRIIGKSGLELQYEASLAGTAGVRYVEVNALGSIVRDFDVGRGTPAVPGEDLYLGIDLELQALAGETFPDTMRGGVVALDPATGEMVGGGDVEAETRQVFTNLAGVLAAAGSGLDLALRLTVFLADMDDFVKVNTIYAGYFGDEPPARATVQVSRLPKDVDVEIDCVAALRS
jgi:penicillin-binding protein 2